MIQSRKNDEKNRKNNKKKQIEKKNKKNHRKSLAKKDMSSMIEQKWLKKIAQNFFCYAKPPGNEKVWHNRCCRTTTRSQQLAADINN